jgi:hypothetical protein
MHLTNKIKHWLRLKGWKKICQANGTPKHAAIAIFISDKADFRPTPEKTKITSG